MTTARCKLLDLSRPGWVHCISRCVRRAFLCGDKFDHRKTWVEDRLRLLAKCFSVEVGGYAVMSNHLHVVVRMQPADTAEWTADQVARRWMSVYPREYLSDGTPVLPNDAAIAAQAKDWSWVSARRKRLGDLGWFMKALKEPISRRANKEDDCTGAFWEGRFKSVPLLDQPALIACLAYVDLNPVRAKMAATPETSRHTGAYQRIRARQRFRKAQSLRKRAPQEAATLLEKAGLRHAARHAEDGLWLCPLARCTVGEELGNRRLTVDDYLTVVDATGRALKAGKRGAIPPELAPILARLEIQVEDWLATMLGRRQMCGAAVGSAAARAAEAARRGLRWVKNHCALFASGERTEAA